MGGCFSFIIRLIIDTVIARVVSQIANEIIRRLTGARLSSRWLWAILAILGLGGAQRIGSRPSAAKPDTQR